MDGGGGGVLPVGVETPLDMLLRSSPPSMLALAEDEEEYSSGRAAQSRCRRRSTEGSWLKDMVKVGDGWMRVGIWYSTDDIAV